ncbi:MAG: DUF86 domain-containing protein [Planctomycetes bacterium]|nr:DUF86 domain-containing protein [Planctomycetota bacterium]
MWLNEGDAGRLWDMLTYARQISQGVSGMTFAQYAADGDRRLATERRLEIIGEAAPNVSQAFMEAHPEIPWRRIIGLRNVLAHEYGDIRQERIFRIVREDIPALVRLLEPLSPPPPESRE